MPCKLSHRVSAQAPEREGICCETGNAVIWSSVIYHATKRDVTNSLKSFRAVVCK